MILIELVERENRTEARQISRGYWIYRKIQFGGGKIYKWECAAALTLGI